jgi:dihydroorotate dehydrogenase (NAD+) catalytic subunit
MPLPDLTCNFLDFILPNPLVLASGIIGTSATLLKRAALAGAGAVTAKSAGPAPRAGHPNPVALDWKHGVINAIGLTNPGAEEEVKMLQEAGSVLNPMGVPLIASIFAGTLDEFATVAATIARAKPDLIEVNISCPNVADDFGTPFAASAESAAQVTEAVKSAVQVPISIKLAPNVPNIGRIAAAVVEAGADAITAVNTMPGMLINFEARKPVLSNRTGGISGYALKPIALRCVAEIASSVKVPIIGTGGVSSGRDAAEMIMAGATAVGVGSAVWYGGVGVFTTILQEMTALMQAEKFENLDAMRGLILK